VGTYSLVKMGIGLCAVTDRVGDVAPERRHSDDWPTPFLVTAVSGSVVWDEDQRPHAEPICALILKGASLKGGEIEVAAVVTVVHAAAIVAGLHLMFAEQDLAGELKRKVEEAIVKDNRGKG
jgi:hypothetical protein